MTRRQDISVSPQKISGNPACKVAQLGYNGTMKEAIVRARVDSKLKSDAEAVFGTLGINLSLIHI